MYVFLDLETLGLNPKTDKILEVGILVLDDNLEELDSFRQVVHFNPYINGEPNPDINDFVFKMHKASKLWEATMNSYLDATRVETMAIQFMRRYPDQEMCGSTISFDRAFLSEQMPALNDMFHYRNLDVSSFRVLFGKLGMMTPDKKEAHRSLADCRESVDNLKFYMQELGLKAQ